MVALRSCRATASTKVLAFADNSLIFFKEENRVACQRGLLSNPLSCDFNGLAGDGIKNKT
jgi:hypothetical protein